VEKKDSESQVLRKGTEIRCNKGCSGNSRNVEKKIIKSSCIAAGQFNIKKDGGDVKGGGRTFCKDITEMRQ